jgi:hypothetical protein
MSNGIVGADPIVPSDVDLRGFPYTPIFRARLFGSSFHAKTTDAEWRAGVTLWLKSWDQVPAGTLPDDDIELCRLAELGREARAWAKVKRGALHGWIKCSDGRLHHPVVAEGVLEAWAKHTAARRKGIAGASKRWGDSHPPTDSPANGSANGSATAHATGTGIPKGNGTGNAHAYSCEIATEQKKREIPPRSPPVTGGELRRDRKSSRRGFSALDHPLPEPLTIEGNVEVLDPWPRRIVNG